METGEKSPKVKQKQALALTRFQSSSGPVFLKPLFAPPAISIDSHLSVTLKTIQAHRKLVENALAHGSQHVPNLGTVLLQFLCVVDGLGPERFASAASGATTAKLGRAH
jgi:hypothetical protein